MVKIITKHNKNANMEQQLIYLGGPETSSRWRTNIIQKLHSSYDGMYIAVPTKNVDESLADHVLPQGEKGLQKILSSISQWIFPDSWNHKYGLKAGYNGAAMVWFSQEEPAKSIDQYLDSKELRNLVKQKIDDSKGMSLVIGTDIMQPTQKLAKFAYDAKKAGIELITPSKRISKSSLDETCYEAIRQGYLRFSEGK